MKLLSSKFPAIFSRHIMNMRAFERLSCPRQNFNFNTLLYWHQIKEWKKLHSVLITLARRELGHLCLACQDNNLHPFEVDRILTALVLVPTIFHTVMIMDANLKYFGTAWLPSCKQIWIGTKIKKLSINMTINLARACLIYVSLYPPTLPI